MTETTTRGLIDVTHVPLKDLWTLDGDVLSQAIRRVTEAAEGRPQRAVSAFNSAV
jgi:FXSXX-COOH protein